LSDDNVPYVKIHPIAIMGILNSYDRRTYKQERVIGTLLGFINEGCIEVIKYLNFIFISVKFINRIGYRLFWCSTYGKE